MSATKILLSALGSGALLGPLAGMAMGPATMKAAPAPAWRLSGQPLVQGAPAYDVPFTQPEDLSPPTWLTDDTGPRPSALRTAADGTRYAEAAYANVDDGATAPENAVAIEPLEPDPAAVAAPPGENGVIVHRSMSAVQDAARNAGAAADEVRDAADDVVL